MDGDDTCVDVGHASPWQVNVFPDAWNRLHIHRPSAWRFGSFDVMEGDQHVLASFDLFLNSDFRQPGLAATQAGQRTFFGQLRRNGFLQTAHGWMPWVIETVMAAPVHTHRNGTYSHPRRLALPSIGAHPG